jgi:two-component system, OmpR family, phosphate regulon sensor histidine kinase PhoR
VFTDKVFDCVRGTGRPKADGMLAQLDQSLARGDGDCEQELRDFSYIVSHDLATEVRHICEFSKILVRDLEADARIHSQRSIDVILAAGDTCRAMLDALRTYSLSQRSALSPRLCNASELVEKAVLRAGSSIRARKAEVFSDVTGTVWGDEALLVDAIGRIIENAAQFHRPDAPSRIELSGGGLDIWALRISDSGIGLDERYWENAFRMYWRLEPRTPERIGAGLAISRRILRGHGGDARFIAAEKGACMEIALPASSRKMVDE